MRKFAAVIGAAALTGTVIVTAPAALAQEGSSRPAQSAASRALQSAYAATMADLATSGGTVSVRETANRDRILFSAPAPAEHEVSYTYQGNLGGAYSVQVSEEGTPVAAWGNNPADGRWSTLGAAGSWSTRFIRGTTLSMSTVVKGMDRRLDMDAADDASRQIIADLALPPGTAKGGRTWNSMRMRQTSSTTVITAKARSKSCAYGSISITLRGGRISESKWTSTCAKTGRIAHESSWTNATGAASAGASAISQAQAMELSSNPVHWKDWQAITRGANLTAATPWSDITRVLDSNPNVVERQVPVVEALSLVDVLIRNGASGIAFSSTTANGTSIVVGASGSNGYFLNLGDTRYAGGSLQIAPDGRLVRFHLTYLDGANADGETITFIP